MAGVKTGTKDTFGMIQEVTEGSFLAPTSFYEYDPGSDSFQDKPEFLDVPGLTGLMDHHEDNLVVIRRDVRGGIKFNKLNDAILTQTLHLFESICGSKTGIGTGGDPFIYALEDTLPTMSAEMKRGAQVEKYDGLHVSKATIEASKGTTLTLAIEMVGMDMANTTGAATSPTLPSAASPFLFVNGVCTVDAGTLAIDSFKLEITNTFDEEDFENKLNRQRTTLVDREITGEIVINYTTENFDVINAKNLAGTAASLDLTFTNGSSVLKFDVNSLFWDASNPNASSREIHKWTLPFMVKTDGTNDAVIISLGG